MKPKKFVKLAEESLNKSTVERLVATGTVSSRARNEATVEKRFSHPPDSLDLALHSSYDHHAVWGAAKGYVVRQREVCCKQNSESKGSPNDRNGDSHKESKGFYRNAAFHVELGVPPHHTSNTRRGYGRSLDGSFYST